MMESIHKSIFLECKDRKRKDFSDGGNSWISRSSDIWLDHVVRGQSILRTIVLGSLVCLISRKLR